MPEINHDSGQWEENTGFEPIPAGEYKAVITASEMKPTKKGDGEYLELTLQIIEGKYENRNQWDRLNLKNPNEQAVQIARGTLSSICKAVGKSAVKNSEELHNIPLLIKVTIQPRSDNGEPSNVIKGYKAIVTNGEPQLSQAAPPKKPSPWKK